MARQDQKTTERRRDDTRPDPQSGDWYSGERENEFGGEGRFRVEGGHGSHFGGEGQHQTQNTNAWRGELRRKFMEKFDRWRSERAARAGSSGPDSASDGSAPGQTGRTAKK